MPRGTSAYGIGRFNRLRLSYGNEQEEASIKELVPEARSRQPVKLPTDFRLFKLR